MYRLHSVVAATVVASVLLLVASLAEASPKQPSRTQDADVNRLLVSVNTKGDLTTWVGLAPHRCYTISNRAELCEFRLGNQQAQWRALADVIDTRKRVALICVFPTDGSARLGSSCAARPMQSNKKEFSVRDMRRRRDVKLKEVRAAYQALANEWIADSLTMVSLSFLLGGVPDRCDPQDAGLQSCVWNLDNSDYGHGTVVTSIGERVGKTVVLRCVLPVDGSPRATDDCEGFVDN